LFREVDEEEEEFEAVLFPCSGWLGADHGDGKPLPLSLGKK
jgi:hypothetical protein